MTRTGGEILVANLLAQGASHAFCVPGESYLAALDALHDSPIDVMICRAEGGAWSRLESRCVLVGRYPEGPRDRLARCRAGRRHPEPVVYIPVIIQSMAVPWVISMDRI